MEEMIEKVKELFEWNKKEITIPKHIAIDMYGAESWALNNNKDIKAAYDESFFKLYKLIIKQIEHKIKSLSILIKPDSKEYKEIFELSLSKFLKELNKDKFIEDNKINISVIGKWYALPNDIVEQIKELISSTSKYNQNYLNLCINYDGKEELIDACRLIARKMDTEKYDHKTIDAQIIKENLYSSNLKQVNLFIQNGKEHNINGFLFWHSIGAVVYITNKLWPDFSKEDLLKAIEKYNLNKNNTV